MTGDVVMMGPSRVVLAFVWSGWRCGAGQPVKFGLPGRGGVDVGAGVAVVVIGRDLAGGFGGLWRLRGIRGFRGLGLFAVAGLVIAGLVIAGLVIAGLVIAGVVIAGVLVVVAGLVVAGVLVVVAWLVVVAGAGGDPVVAGPLDLVVVEAGGLRIDGIVVVIIRWADPEHEARVRLGDGDLIRRRQVRVDPGAGVGIGDLAVVGDDAVGDDPGPSLRLAVWPAAADTVGVGPARPKRTVRP